MWLIRTFPMLLALTLALPAVRAAADDDRMPCGCRKAGAAKAEEPSLPVTDGRKQAGEEFVCPIDGGKQTVAADTPSAEYRGTTYYFCSVEEKEAFLEAPEARAKRDAASDS